MEGMSAAAESDVTGFCGTADILDRSSVTSQVDGRLELSRATKSPCDTQKYCHLIN